MKKSRNKTTQRERILIILIGILLLVLGYCVIDRPYQKGAKNVGEMFSFSGSEYSSDEYGFRVTFPKTLEKPEVLDISKNDVALLRLNSRNIASKEEWSKEKYNHVMEAGPDHIVVEVFENTNREELLTWLKKNVTTHGIYSNFTSEFLTSGPTDVLVSGQKGIAYSWEGIGAADKIVFTNTDKSLIFAFSANYLVEDAQVREDMKKVLESFTFVK